MSLDMTHLENTSNGAKGPTAVLNAFRKISEEPGSNSRASVSKADLSVPFECTPEEESSLIAALRDAALVDSNPRLALADEFWLLACIRARKGDIPRALALADNFLQWRQTIRSDDLNLAKCPKMRQQLERKIIFVSGHTDRGGRPIVNIRLKNQDPSMYSAIDTTRMISFVLEWTLRTFPAAQTHGVVLVNDLSGLAWRNLDMRLPRVFQRAFSRTIPVRVAALNIVNPPFFMRAIFAIAGSILSQKLKARVRLFSKGDEKSLEELFEKDQIMDDHGMGGKATWTTDVHEEWINRMESDCQTWGSCTTYVEVE